MEIIICIYLLISIIVFLLIYIKEIVFYFVPEIYLTCTALRRENKSSCFPFKYRLTELLVLLITDLLTLDQA